MSASLSPAVEDGSEAQIREAAQFPEQNPSPVLRALADGTVLYANKPARAFLAASGWDPTQPLPEPLSNAVRQVLATGLNTELDFTSQNGTICSFVLAPISGAPYVNLYGRDVTEHRAREARIARLTRLYAVLSRVNESIFRTREPQPLFEEVCRILVKQGQFPLVIVGLPQDGALRLATAASLEQLPLTAAANLPEGFPWPGTIAGSFNEPIINNNLSPGDMPAPFAELAHRIGLGSSAFFPFRCHDQPSGVLMLYAAGRAAFDDEQLQLFTALASDVSLALEAMQHDKMRSVVAVALRNSEEQFRAMFELAAVGMAQVEAATGRYLRVNGRFCSMTGYTSAELLNMRFSDLTHHEDQEADWQLFQAALRGETPDYRNEKRYVRKDGSVCWVNVNATILRTASGAPFRTVAVIEDISERKDLESRREQYLSNLNTMVTEEAARRSAAEASLRKRSEILDAFFTHTTAPLAILDRAFNFIRVNGCYAAAAGRKPEEFTGHNHFELYPNAENQVIFQRVVASKIPYQALAKPFLFPDHPEWGITYWDWNLTPLLDDNGDVEFLVLALVDVTQREQTARRDAFTRSLLELFAQKPSRKEYLDSLVEALRSWSGAQCAAVRLVSTRDRIAYVSAAGFDSRFLAEENNLALHTENCICTRAATGTFAKHEQHLLTANRAFYCGNITQFYAALPEDMRADYRGACMAQRFSTIAVIPIRYRDELVGIIQLADERADVFSRCDTEFIESMTPLIAEAIHRFSIEEDLRTASLYFRTLLEASLDPLVTIKLDGLVQDVNRAAEAATGLSREQLIGRDFANCFTEPQNAREAFRQACTDGLVRNCPLSLCSVSGSVMDVLYSAVVYHDETGRKKGVFAAVRDITQQKLAAQEAQQLRDQLSHLMRVGMLGELTSTLAHELSQPLMAIISNAQAARRFIDAGQVNAQQLREILTDIIADDERAGSVIRRIRMLLKKELPHRDTLDLNEIAGETLSLVRSDLLYQGITVETRFTPGLPPLCGDRVQIQQVLLNLLLNASDSLSEMPSARRRLSLTTSAPDERSIEISVADTGSGIPAERLEHIFEPFFTTKEQGMGMGLAISRTIVAAHDGKFLAENNEHGGATFRVILPIP